MDIIHSSKPINYLDLIPEWRNAKETEPQPKKHEISVIGLGYVGTVSMACLANCGHQMVGVDKDPVKVRTINAGASPNVEENLAELLSEAILDEKMSATTSIPEAIASTQFSFVCVGTPSLSDGGCDLSILKSVIEEIGRELTMKDEYHIIVIRSTIPPSTTQEILLPLIEAASNKKCGEGFGLCFHPEFLREGVAIQDFFTPPKTVIGSIYKRDAEEVADIYKGIDDACILTSLESAEAVKYVDNTWHAVKVSFANEIGKICQAKNIDSHEVMDIFVKDTKLNLSPYYLKPGFAYGGSCLPKDVRSINKMAQDLHIETPLLNSINQSNEAQIRHAIQMIKDTNAKKIGILGITFKPDTDDLRESPIIPIISHFLSEANQQAGFQIKVHDENLNVDRCVAHYQLHAKADDCEKNLCMDYIQEIHETDLGSIHEQCDVLVAFHDNPIYRRLVVERPANQHLIDLVRIFKSFKDSPSIMKSGMNDYLQKPFSKENLLSKLDLWMKKHTASERSVLIVEDNPAIANMVAVILKKEGINCKIAIDGMRALKLLDQYKFHSILMDISLPKMNGIKATQTIRNREDSLAYIPIIAMTSYAAPEESSTYRGICW